MNLILDILDLSSKCSSEEIKKSYYSLAQKFHPDKNNNPNAAEKFNEITYAYDILSDEKQRKMYDSYGGSSKTSAYSQQNSSPKNDPHTAKNSNSSNFSDFFEDDLFQDFDKFFFSKVSQNPNLKAKKGKDVIVELRIEFMESVIGCTKTINYTRKCLCHECKGSRCRPGTFASKCYTCGGRGNILYRNENEDLEDICDKCEGLGKIVKFKCEQCKGEGFFEKDISDSVKIPIGVGNEQMLRKEGKVMTNII